MVASGVWWGVGQELASWGSGLEARLDANRKDRLERGRGHTNRNAAHDDPTLYDGDLFLPIGTCTTCSTICCTWGPVMLMYVFVLHAKVGRVSGPLSHPVVGDGIQP